MMNSEEMRENSDRILETIREVRLKTERREYDEARRNLKDAYNNMVRFLLDVGHPKNAHQRTETELETYCLEANAYIRTIKNSLFATKQMLDEARGATA